LPKRGHVIENPERTPVSSDNDVIIMQDEIANRAGRHVQSERLPVLAIVEREIDSALSACEQKTFFHRIFTDRVHDFAGRNSGNDLLPCYAAIMRAIDVRIEIVETESIDRGIGCHIVEV
jgi:hypothetical protein